MNVTKIVVLNVLLYVALFIIMYFVSLNTEHMGGDAAGNALSKGYSQLFYLLISFAIAIILTKKNIFLLRNNVFGWVKLVCFIPPLLPLSFFSVIFFEIGRSSTSIEKQVHKLTFEIRSSQKLKNAGFAFRSSGGGSFSKLKSPKKEDNFYIYKNSNAIFYESGRKFHISSDDFETPKYYLNIPYEPEPIPFTEWELLYDSLEIIKLEFRYKITKTN